MKLFSEKGLTLVEVLAAVSILSLVIMLLPNIFTKNVERIQVDDENMTMINIAQNEMQMIRQKAQAEWSLSMANRLTSEKVVSVNGAEYKVTIRPNLLDAVYNPNPISNEEKTLLANTDVLKIKISVQKDSNNTYELVGYLGKRKNP
ncbi:prepilin-type N-terminal cleavage/methylation domain-containing protein [Ammoniphilus sp. 3BR4]|uniref:type IV pilus modification PilV family protein n=1 Tax=Ammoniphilus sp. 3BR4 TaxID=3158265 RepID=UPI003467E932